MSLHGQQIGRYRIVSLIGSGGMSEVYLAEDARVEQQVALKVVRVEIGSSAEDWIAQDAARLFQREARTIARLDHPHILPLFDYGEHPWGNTTLLYLVMPYRPEGSLSEWLRRNEQANKLLPQQVVHWLLQVAEALQHAHDHQVVHQDVKLSNFLLRERKGMAPDLLLSDFGIARLSSATSSASQSIRGTPVSMAPEQWQGQAVPATDQYALAVMAYHLLVGRPPFVGAPGPLMYQHLTTPPPPISSLGSRFSAQVDAVLMRALAKHPEARFSRITAFAEALQQALMTPMPGFPHVSYNPNLGSPTRQEASPLSPTVLAVNSGNTPAQIPESLGLAQSEPRIEAEEPTALSSRTGLLDERNTAPTADALPSTIVEQARSGPSPLKAKDTPINPAQISDSVSTRSLRKIMVRSLLVVVLLTGGIIGFFSVVMGYFPPWSTGSYSSSGSYDSGSSYSGTGWYVQDAHTTKALSGVAWSDSKFVVVGADGTALTSPDGTTWTGSALQASLSSRFLLSVVWSGSQFVAVGGALGNGDKAILLTSPDGISWTAQTLPTSVSSSDLLDVAWSGSHFVVVGDSGTVLISP
ncbi:serine/threonine-protein kinase [Ktedonospora formicarum]|uniref:non-specific serine/threonine protein kinase n=1 Tax=Ktedonospora formicarum TaxID=2778364 RepID=A0A8J3HYB4_9CHLR|nr:serine/threonine-protein kinase [Ktedonospora formicarum]GHO42199.1 hypothetical protein KSX_03620 [Ktedonospora formicarum]